MNKYQSSINISINIGMGKNQSSPLKILKRMYPHPHAGGKAVCMLLADLSLLHVQMRASPWCPRKHGWVNERVDSVGGWNLAFWQPLSQIWLSGLHSCNLFFARHPTVLQELTPTVSSGTLRTRLATANQPVVRYSAIDNRSSLLEVCHQFPGRRADGKIHDANL